MARPGAPAKVLALVHAWLVLDFFGEARRSGGTASTLTTTIFSQSFLALVVAALLYPEPPPVPFAAANLSLSMLLIALGALEVEQPASRRLADGVLLGTAPLAPHLVVCARALHGAFHVVLLTLGMALPPGVLLACRQHSLWLLPAYLLAACACAALATGSLAVALCALRRWLGLPRTALVAGTLKALLLGCGVAGFALGLAALRKTADALPFGRIGAELLPSYHAAKVLADPGSAAWRILPWLGVALLLLAAATWLGERQREGRERVGRPGLLARLELRVAAGAPERGLLAFTAAMLWRSPGLRARVLPLLGVPAAIAFLALRSGDGRERFLFTAMALQFPAIYLPLVIAFLPRADHPGAAWVFDSAPPVAIPIVRRATWAALCTRLLLPVHGLLFAVLLASGAGALPAAAGGLFSLGTGVVAARAMLRELGCVPFTRDGAEDAPPEFGDLIAFGLVLAAAGACFAMAAPPLRLWLAAAAGAAGLALLRGRR